MIGFYRKRIRTSKQFLQTVGALYTQKGVLDGISTKVAGSYLRE